MKLDNGVKNLSPVSLRLTGFTDSMDSSVDFQIKRFIRMVKEREDLRKVHNLVSILRKEEFVAWRDEHGHDALHYAVMADNAEAVDFLLKMGYFVPPYQPEVNLYAHLAAWLGFKCVLCTILKHRPADFKVSEQPVTIPSDFRFSHLGNFNKGQVAKEPEVLLPAVIGNQMTSHGSRMLMIPGPDSESSRRSSVTMGAPLLLHGRRCRGCTGYVAQGDSEAARKSSNSKPGPTSNPKGTDFGHLASASVVPQHQGHFPAQRIINDPRYVARRKSSLTSTPPGNTYSVTLTTKMLTRRDSLPASALRKKRRNSSPEESANMTPTLDKLNQDLSKFAKCTPLEVAARSKHLECVKALLDMYVLQAYPNMEGKGYITLATLVNNPSSLKLILKSPKPSSTNALTSYAKHREDFETAVEVCIHNIFPECLDLLLADEVVDHRIVFKQVNAFHQVYTSPDASYKKLVALTRLPDLTQVLVKRGYDVKSKIPPRTYPLYSLIDGAFACKDLGFSEYFLSCMRILMENGADPNFDEIKFEHQYATHGFRPPNGGRQAFPSALHCVIQSLENHRNVSPSRTPAVHMVQACLELFTAFGADINQVGNIDPHNAKAEEMGDVLFQLAKSSVTVGLERGLIRCVLRFGAEPEHKINNRFALNVYLDQVCNVNLTIVDGTDVFHKLERDIGMMITLMCDFLPPWHITTVLDVFHLHHNKCGIDSKHTAYVEKVTEALEFQRKQLHQLRSFAAWRVWRLCRRRADNIKKLPLPMEIKTNVLPLLLFQTLW